ncbi:MAG TPA: hypothetical protein VI981_04295 [Candidatus Paceibacterota bacterium]
MRLFQIVSHVCPDCGEVLGSHRYIPAWFVVLCTILIPGFIFLCLWFAGYLLSALDRFLR